MHTVQLKIEDDIYKNVMFLLNNLNLKGFSVKEEKQESQKHLKSNLSMFDAISIDTKNLRFNREEANAR